MLLLCVLTTLLYGGRQKRASVRKLLWLSAHQTMRPGRHRCIAIHWWISLIVLLRQFGHSRDIPLAPGTSHTCEAHICTHEKTLASHVDAVNGTLCTLQNIQQQKTHSSAGYACLVRKDVLKTKTTTAYMPQTLYKLIHIMHHIRTSPYGLKVLGAAV